MSMQANDDLPERKSSREVRWKRGLVMLCEFEFFSCLTILLTREDCYSIDDLVLDIHVLIKAHKVV